MHIPRSTLPLTCAQTTQLTGWMLGGGVLVTREEMVFPCDPDKVDGTGSQMNKSSYAV